MIFEGQWQEGDSRRGRERERDAGEVACHMNSLWCTRGLHMWKETFQHLSNVLFCNLYHPLTLSPFPHLPFNKQSSGLVYAHLHSSHCRSGADTHREIVAVCANFSRLGAFSVHHLTPRVAQVSMLELKKKNKKKPLSLSSSLILSLTLTVGVAY